MANPKIDQFLGAHNGAGRLNGPTGEEVPVR